MTRRLWLDRLMRPLLQTNTRAYDQLNQKSSGFLGTYGNQILPTSVTANAITAARTTLVIPTMFLLSNGYSLLPASMVVVNVAFDYVDGAVARWERTDQVRKDALERARRAKIPSGFTPSYRYRQLDQNWGAYFDAIADKAFAIPVWACCFQFSSHNPALQSVLLMHMGIEIFSSYTRTKALFDEPSPPPVVSTDQDASSPEPVAQSAVVAGAAGKAKQFFSMLGTSLIMIPTFELPGTLLLGTAIPLALLSVYQKSQSVVVYAEFSGDQVLDAQRLAYLNRVRSHGTTLVVGFRPGKSLQQGCTEEDPSREMLLSLSSVDHIIAERLPNQIDSSFLERYGIDKVALPATSTLADAEWVCPGLLEDGRVVSVPV